jgi:hypothetical protein
MKNKKLLIGGAVVAGALLFLYFRNKQSNADDQDLKDIGLGDGVGTGSTTTTTGAGSGSTTTGTTTGTGTGTGTSAGVAPTQLSKLEVETRVFKACGVKPPSFKKRARNLYDDCKDRTKANLKSQGLISFDGSFDSEKGVLDFGNNID